MSETHGNKAGAVNQSGQGSARSLSDRRRQQILDGAAECFRRRGFHGASISQICREIGMSPGNLYYFFESKEAIIGGIVERNLEKSLEVISHLEAATDVFGNILDGVDDALAEKSDPDTVALWLEVLAEAARNPEIADMMREADRKVRERIAHLIEAARESRGIESRVDPQAASEVLAGVFEGVANRSVQNPDRDSKAVAEVLRIAMTAILEG